MTWREYHEATKHSVESLRRARHVLDWANLPDPFRHYEGVPVLDLPADPPVPEMPALDVLLGTLRPTSVSLFIIGGFSERLLARKAYEPTMAIDLFLAGVQEQEPLPHSGLFVLLSACR
jgi:hypothetical protein